MPDIGHYDPRGPRIAASTRQKTEKKQVNLKDDKHRPWGARKRVKHPTQNMLD